MCFQWDHQQLHLHADGVWQLGSEHLAAKPQNCESPREEVLLEEHAGGCANYPQTWSASCLNSIVLSLLYFEGWNLPYVLRAGIVHSDLKPANFVIVNASLKLIDFGIANRIQPDVTSIMKDSQVRLRSCVHQMDVINQSTLFTLKNLQRLMNKLCNIYCNHYYVASDVLPREIKSLII